MEPQQSYQPPAQYHGVPPQIPTTSNLLLVTVIMVRVPLITPSSRPTPLSNYHGGAPRGGHHPPADKCTTIHGRPRSIINLTRSSIILEAAIINQCSHTQEANHTHHDGYHSSGSDYGTKYGEPVAGGNMQSMKTIHHSGYRQQYDYQNDGHPKRYQQPVQQGVGPAALNGRKRLTVVDATAVLLGLSSLLTATPSEEDI